MQYYFAPLEGLTDSVYRALHHKYFPGVDRYYTPFFSPTVHRQLTPRESRELPPADSLDACVIPQLLTKVADDFIWMAHQCKDLGYEEVNLNLGCPSGTVTAKGKGSGMLRNTEELDCFLEQIYANSPLPISIKTRIGFTSPEEFPKLLEIFNQYPVCQLIVHPRVRSAFYAGTTDMEAFDLAVKTSNAPVCYNGDLKSLSQAQAIANQYPEVNSVMIGRGLIADPGMLTAGGTTIAQLEAFYNELTDACIASYGGARNAMFRMKEHWGMLQHSFEGGEKLFKALRKTTDLNEYRHLTQQIFSTLSLKNNDEKKPEMQCISGF